MTAPDAARYLRDVPGELLMGTAMRHEPTRRAVLTLCPDFNLPGLAVSTFRVAVVACGLTVAQ